MDISNCSAKAVLIAFNGIFRRGPSRLLPANPGSSFGEDLTTLYLDIFQFHFLHTQCTMRLSPLQSVNRTIYQNVYLAPHFSSSIISDDKYLKKIFDHFHFQCIFHHLSHAIIRFNSILRIIWGRVEC